MAVHQRWTAARAAMRRRLPECAQAGHRIVAVDLRKKEVGEIGDQPRNVSARRVHFNGNADGVAVVFDHEDHGQLLIGRRVQRFPKLALRSRALAYGGQNHFVAVEIDVVKLAIVAGSFDGGLRMVAEIAAGLSAAHGMEQLGRRRGGCADDVQGAAAPMSGHLTPATGRVGGRAYRLQQHVVRADAQCQAKRAIAIVGKKPVVAGLESQRRAHLQGFMAGGRNLEKDFLLALEENFPVVHRAREKHQAVDFDQLRCGGLIRSGRRSRRASPGNSHFHSGRPPGTFLQILPTSIVPTCQNPAFIDWDKGWEEAAAR